MNEDAAESAPRQHRFPVPRPDRESTALAVPGVFLARAVEDNPRVVALVKSTRVELARLNERELDQRPAVRDQYNATAQQIMVWASEAGGDVAGARVELMAHCAG